MKIVFFVPLFLGLSTYCFADAMRDALKNGKSFGKEQSKEIHDVIKNTKIDEVNSDETFDPDKARKMLLEKQNANSDACDHLLSVDVQKNKKNKGFTEDEYFLERGNEVINASNNSLEEVESFNQYEEIKCMEAVDLVPITIERNLKVTLSEPIPATKEVRICKGHKIKKEWYKEKKNNAKTEYEQFKKDLTSNPSTKQVIFEEPHHHSYKISVKYTLTHTDDAPCCDHFQLETRAEEGSQEIVEEWIYADESLLPLIESPDCMLIKQECTDANSTKTINGKEIKRSCWKERLSFLTHQKTSHECTKLKNKKCDLIEKTCLKEGVNGCALWELTYKCYKKLPSLQKQYVDNSCLDEVNWETAYEPNHSLADITTKLAIFEEIEKEMEKSQDTVSNIRIFDAKKLKCSKSIASDLIYDCCFANKGLATKAGLAKCNADELALAEMREKGVCHYIGHYSKSALGVKTEDKHVFCCFGSKLARIINEQGREQLGMNWGSAEHPECKGFSIDELGRLNFSKLDLTEIFEDYNKDISENSKNKLGDFQDRLKQRMEQISNDIK